MAKLYSRKQNTPLVRKFHGKKATITDPRHVLFGRKLSVVGVYKNGQGVECCVINLGNGLERSIPVEWTDLSAAPPSVYPLPLDVPSIERLLLTFGQILRRSRDRGGKRK